LFGKPRQKNRELLGVIGELGTIRENQGKLGKIGKNWEKSGITGIPIFPKNSRLFGGLKSIPGS
jgi:hypothetical protein